MPQKTKSIRDFFTPATRSRQVTAPPPAPAATELPAPTTALADSFSASQTSAHSGPSKRVVSNGEHVVLNSDSDSDSLPDLDWGLPTPKVDVTAYATRSKPTPRHNDDGLRKPPPKKNHGAKRPFSLLMETAQKHMEVEREIAEHKAHLDSANDEPSISTVTINKDLLKHAVGDGDDDEEDKADRLYAAMQRTSDVKVHVAYQFFEPVSASVRPRFPLHSLPEHGWTTSFEEPSTRDQAFMTGFANQIFRLQELPQELASWMIDEICVGRNESLNLKYLEILESHHDQLHTLLDRNKLNTVLKAMGAKLKNLTSSSELTSPSKIETTPNLPLPPSLKSLTTLLRGAAPWLHNKTRSHAFHLLCHICMDNRVLSNADILNSVQDALEAIVCQFPDNQKLVSGVGCPSMQHTTTALIVSQLSDIVPQLLLRVTHPILQKSLVCAFPTRTPLTAYLQRHLALAFLLYPAAVDVPLTDPTIPSLIHKHLDTSPDFRTRKDTDYSLLAARFTLLDVAIGPGLLSVPYRPLTSPVPSQAGSSPVMAPLPASLEIKEFNKEVDALAQHIKLLGNSIVEAGAAVDLTILDAKERSERLYYRLQHAVRIGGKKADDVFGNDEDEGKQPKMSRYFMKREKPLSAGGGARNGIFGDG